MPSRLYPVILAGGLGTRLWPLSRASHPKQVRPLLGLGPLVAKVYRVVRQAYPKSRVYVSTTRASAPAVRRLLPGLPQQNLLIEPVKRDTAPAIGYAATVIRERDHGAALLIVNSDAWIGEPDAFHRAVEFAWRVVQERPESLVLVAANPVYPETGYGYIEIGLPVMKFGNLEAFTVQSFKEKPSLRAAKRYLNSWRYLWNTTLIVVRADTLLGYYHQHLPQVARGLDLLATSIARHGRMASSLSVRVFQKFPSVSIDYGILEKIDKRGMIVIPADFGWADVGSFRTVHEILSHGSRKNIVKGMLLAIDASNNLVIPQKKKLVALLGVKNLIMVETDDAILLCHKERSQEVKKMVEMLKKRGLKRYL